MSSIYNLDTFETHDLKTFKLESRPGIKDLLSKFQDDQLSGSLKDGLRLSMNSVLYTHQRIVQIFTLLQSGEDPWDELYSTFKNSDEMEK